MIQQGTGLQGPSVAVSGGSITVQVSTGDTSVTVSTGGPNESTHPVGSDGSATIPVPNAPAGTVLLVVVGQGLSQSVIAIEIIAPSP
jgi:hypothetical protein